MKSLKFMSRVWIAECHFLTKAQNFTAELINIIKTDPGEYQICKKKSWNSRIWIIYLYYERNRGCDGYKAKSYFSFSFYSHQFFPIRLLQSCHIFFSHVTLVSLFSQKLHLTIASLFFFKNIVLQRNAIGFEPMLLTRVKLLLTTKSRMIL